MSILKRFMSLVRLALSGLDPVPLTAPAKETADESQPQGFDTRGPLVAHKRRVVMDPPGALVQVRSVKLEDYEGPLTIARKRADDPGYVP